MALNSFDEKYKSNIEGLAKSNNVDFSIGAAMLRSNLQGSTQYKGGGVLDFGKANTDLKNYLGSAEAKGTSTNKITTQIKPRLESDIYALQEKQRLQALEQAKKSGLANLEAEKKNINPYYNTALSTLGGQSALGARNLQEYLAQRGMTNSGVSAQAEINRQGTLNTGMANIEQERSNTLADIERRKSEILNTYDTGALNSALQTQIDRSKGSREDFLNTVGAYGQDYQAQINKLTNDGDPSNDWQIPYLNQARNEKITGIQQAQAEAEQQAFENYLKQAKLNYDINKPYYNPNTRSSGGGTSSTKPYGLTLSQAQTAYKDNQRTVPVLKTLDYFLNTDYSNPKVGFINEVAKKGYSQQGFDLWVKSQIQKGNITEADYQAWAQKYGE